MTPPPTFDLASLRRAYDGGLDPVAVVDAVLARIAAVDDPGLFITLLDRDALLTQIGALGPRNAEKPLWGVPFAVKDNIDVAGLPTTAGCQAFARMAQTTAPAIVRLQAAGAILIGKTNLDQFATGLVGVRTPYPVPKNAFDPERVPGGSSSGSGLVVARGLVCFALGTDTAGSGRVPAALNNIVGLKPTPGAVPTTGVVPACRSLDCVSVFALTVDDAYAVFAAMAGPDAGDPFSRSFPAGPVGAPPPSPRIGVPSRESLVFDGDDLSAAAWDASLKDLEALGASLVPVDLRPFFAAARLLYEDAFVAERTAAIGDFIAAHPDKALPVTRRIVEGGRRFSAVDAFRARYALAGIAQATAPVWTGIDALAVPSIPRPVRLSELDADPIGPNALLGTYTNFVNLLDLCALAVPGRFRADGFPAGLTLIAPQGHDAALAGLGRALHALACVPMGATGISLVRPEERPCLARPTEIELAVVGAHLSGLALNHQLRALGARFLRAVTTQPCYRLFALPGGPPHRPGLVRVAAGEGYRIEAEIWALDPAGFGHFVSAIPAPLGIGTVLLDDSTSPKGFLAEPEAVKGAEDISSFGGWRAFVTARSQS